MYPIAAIVVIFLAGLGLPRGGIASDHVLRTDVNLITSLDVSRSIHGQDQRIEFDGLAEAIVQPAFLRAVKAGATGRIGFAVTIWSSHGTFRTVVPWTVIETAADAERVAQLVEIAPTQFGRLANPADDTEPVYDDDGMVRPGDLTDISLAVDRAHRLVALAPFIAPRSVINLCANGEDNVGNGPDAARDLALADGVSINGLVIGDAPDLASYLRDHVIGGVGSFVLEARDPRSFADAMLAKFLMDLIATRPLRLAQADVAAHSVR